MVGPLQEMCKLIRRFAPQIQATLLGPHPHACWYVYLSFHPPSCRQAVIAQLAARRSHNPEVVSSILTHRISRLPGCSEEKATGRCIHSCFNNKEEQILRSSAQDLLSVTKYKAKRCHQKSADTSACDITLQTQTV